MRRIMIRRVNYSAYEADQRIAIVSIALRKELVSILNQAMMMGSISVLPSDESYDTDRYSTLNEDSRVLIYLQ